MTYQFPEIKKFSGLYLQGNSFSVPDGALEIADNVVLSKDGIVSKRRGFYQYYDPSSDTINNLVNYQDKLLAVFSNKIGYFTDAGSSPNYTGTRTALTGITVAVTGTRVSRNVLSNKNLYFTTDNGVLKLEAYNSSVFNSGVPPALDLRGQLYGGSGVIADDKLVGWRVVFGRRDANDNLLLGVPSEIFTLTLDGVGHSQNARLEFSLPSEITSTADGYFWQLYRSSQVAKTATSVFSDFKLIDSRLLTSAEITAGVAFFNDDVDDILLGAELYTNQNSQEGESQANYRAPKCDDVTLYKGYVIYGACSTRQLLSLNVVDASSLAAADFVEIKVDSTTRRYVARASVGNQTVTSSAITHPGTPVVIGYTAHGFANDDSVYINNVQGGTLTDGTYYVVSKAADTFQISATIAGTAVAYAGETAVDFQGVRTKETTLTSKAWVRASNVVTVTSVAHGLATGMQIYASASSGGSPDVSSGLYTITVTTVDAFTIASVGADDASGNTLSYAPYQPMFALDKTSGSASVQLTTTARGIIKAVNRDTSSLIYAAYVSGLAGTPGMMQFQAKGFTGAIYVRASGATPGLAFNPVLPSSFSSGTQVYSRNDSLPNTFFSSKFSEPEAVPIVNQFPVGSRNKAILRVLALRDSVIILKEDGVFRVTGDNVFNFTITPIDTTVICSAASSAVVLNNQVFALTNQGVCMISESSVQIVSRKIEDVVQPVLQASTLSAVTGAFSYESERFYGMTTVEPNGTVAGVTYVYNFLNDSWVTWDALFTQGLVGPSDTLYLITTGNLLYKERKNQTRIDFVGQNYAVTVTSVASGSLSAVCSLPASVVPEVGDIIVKSNVFNRVTAVSFISGTSFTLTFERMINLIAADSVTLYSKYNAQIKPAPFHAGLVGRSKQFSQMQLHFRDNSVSQLSILFAGDTYGSSEETTWSSILVSAGWGGFPWGFEPWGLEDGVNIQRQTSPAPICRVYVPRFQQRGTFIQPIITHSRAGEAINLQAISFSVRAYNERVSR